jgi:hypothetical protein
MQRPEDFVLGPGAQQQCDAHDLDPWDVRSARANAIAKLIGDFGEDGQWSRFVGDTPSGRRLVLLCGPEPNVIASFRPQ